jgi:hypothetical protein
MTRAALVNLGLCVGVAWMAVGAGISRADDVVPETPAAAPVVASPERETVAQLLARVKAASGGDTWDALRTWYTRESFIMEGERGEYQEWRDVLTGRYASRGRLGDAIARKGFDGTRGWETDWWNEFGVEHVSKEANTSAGTRAYFFSLAWWYPKRWQGAISDGGTRVWEGRSYRTIRFGPAHGQRLEMWIDPRTATIERWSAAFGDPNGAMVFSDQRWFKGLRLPFAYTTGAGTEFRIEEYRINEELPPGIFEVPERPVDFSLPEGQTATRLLCNLDVHGVIVDVWLNDRGPYRFVLHNQSEALLARSVARDLGLDLAEGGTSSGNEDQAGGITLRRVAKAELGNAVLRDHIFRVAPPAYEKELVAAGVAGFLGRSLLARFVTTVDVARGTLSLSLPTVAVRGDLGRPIRCDLGQDAPRIPCQVDHLRGTCVIDLAEPAAISLRPAAVASVGLRKAPLRTVRYRVADSDQERVRVCSSRVRLGKVVLDVPSVEMGEPTETPVPAGEIGVVGAGILNEVALTFDSAGNRVYVQSTKAPVERESACEGSGIELSEEGGGLLVRAVAIGGPADAAGLTPGDEILTIDGRPVAEVGVAAIRKALRGGGPGIWARLTVWRVGKTK